MAKEKALLVVSFGSTYLETVEKSIAPVEEALKKAFPDRDFFRVFSSKFIVKKLRRLGSQDVCDVEETLRSLAEEGYRDILIQPTFILPGLEYEKMMSDVHEAEDSFDRICVGKPLLWDQEDFESLCDCLLARYPKEMGVVLLMGHGTNHFVNCAYPALAYTLLERGVSHLRIATVEGHPTFSDALESLKGANVQNVTLVPLMLVAGDHARNDMAGDEEDSWKSQLDQNGIQADCLIRGLGEDPAIGSIYLRHAQEAE